MTGVFPYQYHALLSTQKTNALKKDTPTCSYYEAESKPLTLAVYLKWQVLSGYGGLS